MEISLQARQDLSGRTKEIPVPLWLILIIIGVVLVILGVATEIGQFLLWIGVIVLVVSLVLGLLRRAKN
jgi:purine-cytosine permease-like protein